MTLQETVQTIEAVRSAIESGGGMAELAKLSDAAGVPPKQVFSKAFEEKHRVQISTVCQQYAMTGEWPVLTPAQQLLVCERLQAAALHVHDDPRRARARIAAGGGRPVRRSQAADVHPRLPAGLRPPPRRHPQDLRQCLLGLQQSRRPDPVRRRLPVRNRSQKSP